MLGIISVVQNCKRVNLNHPVFICEESPILKIPVHGTPSKTFGKIFLHMGERKTAYLKIFTFKHSVCLSHPKKIVLIKIICIFGQNLLIF